MTGRLSFRTNVRNLGRSKKGNETFNRRTRLPQHPSHTPRANEILSQNLACIRPQSGLEAQFLEVNPDFEPLPIPTEQLQRSRAYLERQIRRIRNAQLVFFMGIHSGLVPAVLANPNTRPDAVVVLLEHSEDSVRSAFHLYDLRAVLTSPDVYWCIGPDLKSKLADLFRRESLYMIGRNLIAALPAPGLSAEETQAYQTAISSAYTEITPDYSSVCRSLREPVTIPEHGPSQIWTYNVPNSFHAPIVHAIADGFRANGLSVHIESIQPCRTVPLRLVTSLARVRPDFVVLLNMPGGDFVRPLGLPKDNLFLQSLRRVAWFSDSSDFYSTIGPDSFDDHDTVFWMDRTFEPALSCSPARKGGFLPVAASVTRAGEVRERFQHPVAFVGNVTDLKDVFSALPQADRGPILDQIDRLVSGDAETPMECARMVCPSKQALEIIEKVVGVWRATPLRNTAAVAYFLYVAANSEKRVRYLRPLIPLGLHLYGTDTWGVLFPGMPPERIHGRIGVDNVPDLYRSTQVNIGLHSCQCPTCLNARDFDVLISGGCLVADWVADCEQGLLTDSVHARFPESPESIYETVAELLENKAGRESLASAGQEHVARYHTYTVRIRTMLDRLGLNWPEGGQ